MIAAFEPDGSQIVIQIRQLGAAAHFQIQPELALIRRLYAEVIKRFARAFLAAGLFDNAGVGGRRPDAWSCHSWWFLVHNRRTGLSTEVREALQSPFRVTVIARLRFEPVNVHLQELNRGGVWTTADFSNARRGLFPLAANDPACSRRIAPPGFASAPPRPPLSRSAPTYWSSNASISFAARASSWSPAQPHQRTRSAWRRSPAVRRGRLDLYRC